jgi:hypothetical protein
MLRAYVAAKRKVESTDEHGDELVSLGEFRKLLKYIRKYYEYWLMFSRIDRDGDRRIDWKEFSEAAQLLADWGLKIKGYSPSKRILMQQNQSQTERGQTHRNELPAMTLREHFEKMDGNGGRIVLFDEFAYYAIANKLDLPEDDNDDYSDVSDGEGMRPIAEQGMPYNNKKFV